VDSGSFKDHASVFDSLQWDILKEMGYLSWFGLAFLLAAFLSSHCREEEEDEEDEEDEEEEGSIDHHHPRHHQRRLGGVRKHHWNDLRAQSDFIIEQLDELNLCLESDSNIYKLVAATLLYCCSVIRHLEQQPRK
jgi:hypothetical protein